MDKIEQLSRVVAKVYDAALAPNLWPEALEQACNYVGGATATLLSQDSVAQSSRFFSSGGMIPFT